MPVEGECRVLHKEEREGKKRRFQNLSERQLEDKRIEGFAPKKIGIIPIVLLSNEPIGIGEMVERKERNSTRSLSVSEQGRRKRGQLLPREGGRSGRRKSE